MTEPEKPEEKSAPAPDAAPEEPNAKTREVKDRIDRLTQKHEAEKGELSAQYQKQIDDIRRDQAERDKRLAQALGYAEEKTPEQIADQERLARKDAEDIAKLNAVEAAALRAGIRMSPDRLFRLMDRDALEIDPKTKKVVGIEGQIDKLSQEYPELVGKVEDPKPRPAVGTPSNPPPEPGGFDASNPTQNSPADNRDPAKRAAMFARILAEHQKR